MKTALNIIKFIILVSLLIIITYFLEILAGHDVTQLSKIFAPTMLNGFFFLGIYAGILIVNARYKSISKNKAIEILQGDLTLVEALLKYENMKKDNEEDFYKFNRITFGLKEIIRSGGVLPGGIIKIIKYHHGYKIVDFKNNSFTI